MPVSEKDIRNLGRNIRRNVGRKPYLPVGRVGLSRSLLRTSRIRGGKVTRPSKRVSGRVKKPVGRISGRVTTPKGRISGRVTRPSKRVSGRVTTPRKRVSGRIPRITKRPERPGKILPRLKPRFTPQSLSKSQPTYYVVEKVRGKLKKLYPKPLTLKDAKDYAVYSIDNRLSRTAFFVPLGKAKRVVRPPKDIQDYYSRNAQKVRPYRIRFGKKRELVNGFIEKRKYIQDTPGEKRQIRGLRKPIRRKMIKRKINPQQRRELLKRLAKARAVRMRNLRRK